MKPRSLIVAAIAVIVLSACASTTIPRGPALTYEQLLPNTAENPVWARNAQPTRAPETSSSAQPPAAAR